MLYAIPGATALSPALLQQHGLSAVLEGRRGLATREYAHGPGGRGIIVAPEALGEIGYYPDRQHWTECGTYWLGVPHSGIDPDLLRRPDPLPGHLCQLGDRRDWLCPCARRFRDMNGTRAVELSLPAAAIYRDGKWIPGPVQPEFARLHDLASEFWDRYWASEADEGEDGIRVEVLWEAERDACHEALAVNYWVRQEEISALRLLTQQAVGKILAALIDLPTLMDAMKKKTNEAVD